MDPIQNPNQPQDTPQIPGLPAGVTLRPVSQPATTATANRNIPGLPPGVTLRPIANPTQSTENVQPNVTATTDQQPTNPARQMQEAMKGAGAELWGMAKGAATTMFPGQNELIGSAHAIPAVYRAYETARQQGKGILDSVDAANQEAKRQNQAVNLITQRIKEFQQNPDKASGRAIVDAVALAFPLALAGAGAGAVEGADAGTAEGVEVGSDTALAEPNPAVSPREAYVQKQTAKVPIREGTPAEKPITPAEQTQKLQTEVQPVLQKGVQDVAQKAAADSGVTPAKTPARFRDTYHVQGNAMKVSARADFQVLDEASGGRWQRFQDQIDNVQRKMDEVSGIDDDQYSDLETKRNSIQTDQAQMIEDLKASGKVDPAVADRANAMYRKAYATYDVGNAVRGATKRVSIGGKTADVTDPNGLAQRLQKLDDQPIDGGQSRLRQATGNNADALLTHVDNAQALSQVIKDYVPNTATGKQALAEIIRESTQTGKIPVGPLKNVTQWSKALDRFEGMTPDMRRAAFPGTEEAAVRSYLQSKALRQALLRTAGIGALATGVIATGAKAVTHVFSPASGLAAVE